MIQGGVDMSFASEVRGEVCQIDITEVCCARAELVGMVCYGASIKNNEIKLRTENAIVAQRFYDLINFLYNIKINVDSTDAGVYYATLEGTEVIKILRDMKLTGVPMRIEREIVRNECCKAAILRGAFLGGGSMIDPNKGYHLELVSNLYSLEADLRQVFEYFELYPKVISRNGNNVFYIKESQQIENLLASIGAYAKMMEFVNVVIERDVRNSVNRRANFEAANATKVFQTALRQQNAIKKIVLEHGWQSISPELAEVAKLRMENLDMSLSEMAEKLGITKSGVNHRMRKLLQLAEFE